MAEDAYTVLIEEVLRRNNVSHVYTGARTQVYMRGDRLLTEKRELLPETCVVNTETGVVITTAWDRMMHTAASDRILSATGHLTLEDARAEGVIIAHPHSVEDLLSHLE